MYAPEIVEKRLKKIAQKRGIDIEYHSIKQVDEANSHFAEFLKKDDFDPAKDLNQDERKWIRNERAIAMCDYKYWLSRYCWLVDKTNNLVRVHLYKAQSIIIDIRAEMEKEGRSLEVQQLKARQLGACLSPETRVLTDDLRWMRIDEIPVGQTIVGVDEECEVVEGCKKAKERRLRTGIVLARYEIFQFALRISLENGQVLHATPHHRFLCRKRKWKDPMWLRVQDLRIDDEIRWITRPWEGVDYEDGWIAGMLDGEGCVRDKKSGGAEACIAQVLGPVYDRVNRYLHKNNYTVREDLDNRKSGESSKLGNKTVAKAVVGRMNDIIRLIGHTRPSRFINKKWWEGKALPGKNSGEGWCKVVKVELLPRQKMIDLQTSTKTYIAEGYVSHNSTEAEFAVGHRAQFYAHVNAVIGSSDPEKSQEMSRMMETNWNNQPWFLLPEMTSHKAGTLFEFGLQDSRVSIQHGNQFSGIARGSTPTICHLSELCDFEDPKDLIDASLFRAVHSSPWVLIILESTAKGRHNWWHETWKYSVENWATGMARLRPIFLPWFISDDIYPTPTEARTRPIPKNWQPPGLCLKHAEKCEEAAKSDPLLRKYLGKDWKMPLEKLWWWWYTRSEYAAKKELAQFYAEVAATPEDAFQNDTTSVFPVELTSEYRENCPEPKGVYGIIGNQNQIPMRLWPDRRDFDTNNARIEVVCNWSGTGKPIRFDLVPLKFQGYATFNPDMKLLVYEWPKDDEEYAVGVDTAEGIGLDATDIEVLRKGDLIKNDKQCACLNSHWLSAFDAWPHTLAIATLYSGLVRGRLKQCRLVIECRSNGENTQNECKKRGWRNFHPWLRYDAKKIRVDKAHKIGWFTNQWSRDLLTDYLIKGLRDGWIEVCSPNFVDEMADFQKDEYAQSLRACFTPGTKVLLASGELKNIEDVVVGDSVICVDGSEQKVQDHFKYPHRGRVVSLKVSGLPFELSSTADHLYWVKPRTCLRLQATANRKKFPSLWMPAERIRPGDWVCVPKRQALPLVNLSPDQLWAIGFWLAEGSYAKDKHRHCGLYICNTIKSKVSRWLEIMKDWFPENEVLNNQFGGKKIVKTRTYENSSEPRNGWKSLNEGIVYNKEAVAFFLGNFGEHCSDKRLSPEFYKQSGLLPMVEGFINGDGHQRKNQQNDVTAWTTSGVLAWQLRQIALDHGVYATINRRDNKPPRKEVWMVNIKASQLSPFKSLRSRTYVNNCNHWIQDETAFWVPVRSVKITEQKTQIHDLQIENSSTYNVCGVGVHNSYGGHDDRLMALGMALISIHILEIRGAKKSIIEQRMELRSGSEDEEEFDLGLQAHDMEMERTGRMMVRVRGR
jgi:hypothetical protein